MLSPLTIQIRKANRLFDEGLKEFNRCNYPKALALFRESLTANTSFNALKDYKILYHIFRTQRKMKDFKQSTKTLLKLTRIFPVKTFSNFEHGLVKLEEFFRTNDKTHVAEALTYFTQVLAQKPDKDAYYYNGFCKALLGNDVEAEKDFKMTLLLDRGYRNIHNIEQFNRIRSGLS